MKILIFNVGSSSIKFKLFSKRKDDFKKLKSGGIDRIGEQVPDHSKALEQVIKKYGLNLDQVDIIGHRVVHGGSKFSQPTKIDDKVIEKLKEFSKLAPLHNPPEIKVIQAIDKKESSLEQFAVFDTGFFINLPEKTKIYPLPFKYYKEDNIRRYGFHGISHKYLSNQGASELELDLNKTNLITVHLGAGSSIAAVKKGKPVDISLGFTPLEGLMMQTRSGDIDPGIIIYLQKDKGLTVDEIDKLLNNQSGLLGISGRADMRDVLFLAGEKVEDDNYQPRGFDDCSQDDIKRAKLALDMFCYRVSKYIAAYRGILGNLDGLVFGGAIGSGSSVIRNKITENIKQVLEDTKITDLKTNEELQIAKDIAEKI